MRRAAHGERRTTGRGIAKKRARGRETRADGRNHAKHAQPPMRNARTPTPTPHPRKRGGPITVEAIHVPFPDIRIYSYNILAPSLFAP